MSKKSFASVADDAVAQATAHALSKFGRAPEPVQAPVEATAAAAPAGSEKTIQWNVRLKPHLREKLRNAAFAWRMTERDLVEAFIEQLPEVAVPSPEAPASVAWLKK